MKPSGLAVLSYKSKTHGWEVLLIGGWESNKFRALFIVINALHLQGKASLLVPRCFDRGKGAVVFTLQIEYMTNKVKGSHLSCIATAKWRLWTIFTEKLPENRTQECLCFHRRWAQPLSKANGLLYRSYFVNLPEMFSHWAASWFYFTRGKACDGKTPSILS